MEIASTPKRRKGKSKAKVIPAAADSPAMATRSKKRQPNSPAMATRSKKKLKVWTCFFLWHLWTCFLALDIGLFCAFQFLVLDIGLFRALQFLVLEYEYHVYFSCLLSSLCVMMQIYYCHVYNCLILKLQARCCQFFYREICYLNICYSHAS